MGYTYELDPRDHNHWRNLVAELHGYRKQRGWSYEQAGKTIGRSPNFLYEMENMKGNPVLLNLQQWASMFDMRLEFQLDGFWFYSWNDPELSLLYSMSRPFGAQQMQRLWLVSALKAWRLRRGITSTEAGEAMGMKRIGVVRWESEASNPTLARVMQQARVTGTQLQMRLWLRDEWVYG
jgi:transcriptional regulator with XRE-family HTH domain